MSRAVKNRNLYYKKRKYLHIIPENDEYSVSLQAAIWEKSFLNDLLGEGSYNTWNFELNRVKETEG